MFGSNSFLSTASQLLLFILWRNTEKTKFMVRRHKPIEDRSNLYRVQDHKNSFIYFSWKYKICIWKIHSLFSLFASPQCKVRDFCPSSIPHCKMPLQFSACPGNVGSNECFRKTSRTMGPLHGQAQPAS